MKPKTKVLKVPGKKAQIDSQLTDLQNVINQSYAMAGLHLCFKSNQKILRRQITL
jgi:hypothetical protein